MLSIPRDLWVTIPGFGEGRINTSYQLGENNKETIPGGGPTLAMSTIEQNFGIRIHYFAQVDFVGFERVLDAMGGITIDVPKPLVDNEYPLTDYGASRIYIPAGLQHLDGHTALQYARSRHSDSDLGRNSRQQQVLLALKQQALSLNILSRLTDIVNQLAGAVKTDLTFLQVTSLVQLARDIGPSSIQTVLIEPPLVNSVVLASGADVLMPDWSLIRPKVTQLFGDPRLAAEAARISVLNGTEVGGMARRTSDLLIAKGLAVVNVASVSDPGNYPVTTISDYTGGTKPNTLAALAQELGVDPADVVEGDPADAPLATSDGEPVDIVIIVGDDKAQ
jgi:LCP family protein required for cell wall assembly